MGDLKNYPFNKIMILFFCLETKKIKIITNS